MSNVVITYDIWIYTIVCHRADNFLPQLVCLRRTILPAAYYNHCLPFECTYHALTICHMSLHLTYGKSELWAIIQVSNFCRVIHDKDLSSKIYTNIFCYIELLYLLTFLPNWQLALLLAYCPLQVGSFVLKERPSF